MWKNAIGTVFLAATLAVAGCASEKTIDGVTYGTYGLFNKDEVRDPKVNYTTVGGNVFWGIVLVETLIAPVYFFGFSLYEPTGLKPVKAEASHGQ